MKLLKTVILLGLFSTLVVNANNSFINNYNQDSIDVRVEASLFFEAYKNKQYEMWTIEKGFNVINTQPNFENNKYTLYRKIDKVIFKVYADTSVSEETRTTLIDTILYLYEKGIKNDPEYAGTYMVKIGYVLNDWKGEKPEVSIASYEAGFASGKKITNEVYYLDKLGTLYIANINDENDYQMKALDIYLKLSDMEPENSRWPQIVTSLAEDEEQLQEFLKIAWLADKENGEKAWKYAKMCKKLDDYEASIEPLQFLIDKSPEVINYWNEIARSYQKINQTDKAVDSYKKLINLQPENKDSYYNLALLYKDMGQLSVARSYLRKSSKVAPGWDAPIYIEAGLYEQAARSCGFEFEDKCVYQLAVDTYTKASKIGGDRADQAKARVKQLANSIPTKEEYFFRNKKKGDVIKIEGKCYDWIGKSITVSF